MALEKEPARQFNPKLPLRVWARVDLGKAMEKVGTTPAPRPLEIPACDTWWVEPLPPLHDPTEMTHLLTLVASCLFRAAIMAIGATPVNRAEEFDSYHTMRYSPFRGTIFPKRSLDRGQARDPQQVPPPHPMGPACPLFTSAKEQAPVGRGSGCPPGAAAQRYRRRG